MDDGSRSADRRWNGFSLAAKLNIIVIAAILLVSIGLLATTLQVNSDKALAEYQERMDNASEIGVYLANPEGLAFLWECTQTDEFTRAHQQALEANSEKPLIDWMKSIDASHVSLDAGDIELKHNQSLHEYETLYDVYMSHLVAAEYVQTGSDVTSAYIQFMKGGVTYNLIDPQHDARILGTIEAPLPEFAQYADNEAVPPTVYHSQFGWLCTACTPLVDTTTGKAVAMFCFDADMTQVEEENWGFMMSSVIYVVLVTALAMVASLYLIRRFATKPLQQLTESTCNFYDDDSNAPESNIIELDIRSNDEIGNLYREIRSMQSRIVDYTENIARASAEEERVKTELSMATSIQESVMPNIFPCFPDRMEFDIYASMDAAKDVGGDFYDFFLIDNNHLALVIADVSGKGVPAALFMMAVKIMIDDRAMAGGTPAEILASVNRQICSRNTTKTFVTVWMGILDITTGIVTCANAGHNYPWIRGADGSFRMLKDKHGLVVGGVKSMKYTDYTIELSPGDAIFVHTDGVNESMNANKEFFGLERLDSVLNSQASATPEDIIRTMQGQVDAFMGGTDRFDDITMLCLEYRGGTPTDNESPDVLTSGKELTLPATIESIPQATEFVITELNALDCPVAARTQIAVAIDEILSNIAKFAYETSEGNVTVRFAIQEDNSVAEITFIDQGIAYNPLDTAEPDITLSAKQRAIGGLGVFLVKKTMDDVHYERVDDQNILRIYKRITR